MENFSRQGIQSKCQVILGHFSDTNLPTVIHNWEWESLCDEPVTCPLILIQEFYSNMHEIDRSVPHLVTCVRGISIPVTPQLVTDLLRVPRIEFPNYPFCKRLRTVSKDKLMSSFYECPLEWGKHQFTYCLAFAKPLYYILSHTTTPLRSLVLISYYLFLSILPWTSPPTLLCPW